MAQALGMDYIHVGANQSREGGEQKATLYELAIVEKAAVAAM